MPIEVIEHRLGLPDVISQPDKAPHHNGFTGLPLTHVRPYLPSLSPVLSLIEHNWDYLGRQVE